MVAVERPYGVGKSIHDLMRAMGAVVAALPPALMVWELSPAEWRKGIGLPGNASKGDCKLQAWHLAGYAATYYWPQDALDAYAVAYTARAINQQAIEAA
jgi:Holliday junction resolvasome RuvABC endonuclease subunit